MNKEHPILFSTEMVKAILEGRKVQTRRVCKGARELSCAKDWPIASCPYGRVGDRLWVRETWREPINKDSGYIDYLADYINKPLLITWKPSIFMPRWASRITLEITDIRVERLQDITIKHDEVAKEGWPFGFKNIDTAPVNLFIKLWDSINGKKHPWASNPWVWVISFKRI